MNRSAHSCPVFGESATIRVSGDPLPEATAKAIRRRWRSLEERFDLSRPNSELSLVASGRGSVQHASAQFRAAHADAIRRRLATDRRRPARRTAVATARADEPQEAEFVQATVLGRDIVAARALATAVAAGGVAAFELAIARWPVDVLAVGGAGALRWTRRLERRVRRSSEGNGAQRFVSEP